MSRLRPFLVPLALLGVAVGLGVAVRVDRSVHEGVDPTRARHLAPSFEEGSVQRLRVEAGGGAIALERRAGEGNLFGVVGSGEEPEVARLSRLLAALRRGIPLRVVGPGSVGTRLATLTWEAREPGGKTFPHTLVVGAEAPSPPRARYAQLDDGPVVVISGDLVEDLAPAADALRDRRLLPPGLPARGALVVTEGGAARTYAFSAGKFTLPDGDGRPHAIAREASDALATAFADLLADAPATPPTGAAPLRVEVRGDGPEPLATLAFYGQEGCSAGDVTVVVTRDGKTRGACVAGGVSAAFRVSPEALVDRSLLGLRADEITGLRVDGGRLGEYARTGDGWTAREGGVARPLAPREGPLVDGWLHRLTAARGELLRAAPSPLPPAIPLDVDELALGGAEAPRRRVTFYGAPGAPLFVEREGRWLSVEPGAAAGVLPFAGFLTDAPLGAEIALSAVRAVTLGCKERATVRREGDRFVFTDGRGPVDQAALASLLDDLRSLQPQGFLPPDARAEAAAPCAFAVTYGDGSYALAVSGRELFARGRRALVDAPWATRLARGVADEHALPYVSPTAILAARFRPAGGEERPLDASALGNLLVPARARGVAPKLPPFGLLTVTRREGEAGTEGRRVDDRYELFGAATGPLALRPEGSKRPARPLDDDTVEALRPLLSP